MMKSSGEHRRGRSMGSPAAVRVGEKDEDLALFHEMKRREKHNFLHPSPDDLDATLSSKFGGMGAPIKKHGTDLLTSESDKNDYDWLLTPPGTPLFPSLDQEAAALAVLSPALSNGSFSSASSATRSLKSLYSPAESVTKTSSRGNPSPGRRPTTPNGISRSRSSSAALSRPSTPTSTSGNNGTRPSTPTTKSSPSPPAPSVRASAPKLTTSQSSKSYSVSTTPTGTRPSTPTPRSSTPPVRPSTPGGGGGGGGGGRSSTPTSKPSTPTMRRSLSGGRINSPSTAPTTTTTSSRGGPSPKRTTSSSRGNSPATKRVTSVITSIAGMSSEAPPNLRTTMPDRPTSSGGHNGSDNDHSNRRRPRSPSVARSFSSSSSQDQRQTSSQTSRGSVFSSHDDGLEVNRPSMGRNSAGKWHSSAQEELMSGKGANSFAKRVARPSISSKDSGYGGGAPSKRSPNDTVKRQDAYQNSPTTAYRHLHAHNNSHSPVSSSGFYSGMRSNSLLLRAGSAVNSSVTTSSNASSEHGTTIAADTEGSERDEDDLLSWDSYGRRLSSSPRMPADILVLDRDDEKLPWQDSLYREPSLTHSQGSQSTLDAEGNGFYETDNIIASMESLEGGEHYRLKKSSTFAGRTFEELKLSNLGTDDGGQGQVGKPGLTQRFYHEVQSNSACQSAKIERQESSERLLRRSRDFETELLLRRSGEKSLSLPLPDKKLPNSDLRAACLFVRDFKVGMTPPLNNQPPLSAKHSPGSSDFQVIEEMEMKLRNDLSYDWDNTVEQLDQPIEKRGAPSFEIDSKLSDSPILEPRVPSVATREPSPVLHLEDPARPPAATAAAVNNTERIDHVISPALSNNYEDWTEVNPKPEATLPKDVDLDRPLSMNGTPSSAVIDSSCDLDGDLDAIMDENDAESSLPSNVDVDVISSFSEISRSSAMVDSTSLQMEPRNQNLAVPSSQVVETHADQSDDGICGLDEDVPELHFVDHAANVERSGEGSELPGTSEKGCACDNQIEDVPMDVDVTYVSNAEEQVGENTPEDADLIEHEDLEAVDSESELEDEELLEQLPIPEALEEMPLAEMPLAETRPELVETMPSSETQHEPEVANEELLIDNGWSSETQSEDEGADVGIPAVALSNLDDLPRDSGLNGLPVPPSLPQSNVLCATGYPDILDRPVESIHEIEPSVAALVEQMHQELFQEIPPSIETAKNQDHELHLSPEPSGADESEIIARRSLTDKDLTSAATTEEGREVEVHATEVAAGYGHEHLDAAAMEESQEVEIHPNEMSGNLCLSNRESPELFGSTAMEESPKRVVQPIEVAIHHSPELFDPAYVEEVEDTIEQDSSRLRDLVMKEGWCSPKDSDSDSVKEDAGTEDGPQANGNLPHLNYFNTPSLSAPSKEDSSLYEKSSPEVALESAENQQMAHVTLKDAPKSIDDTARMEELTEVSADDMSDGLPSQKPGFQSASNLCAALEEQISCLIQKIDSAIEESSKSYGSSREVSPVKDTATSAISSEIAPNVEDDYVGLTRSSQEEDLLDSLWAEDDDSISLEGSRDKDLTVSKDRHSPREINGLRSSRLSDRGLSPLRSSFSDRGVSPLRSSLSDLGVRSSPNDLKVRSSCGDLGFDKLDNQAKRTFGAKVGDVVQSHSGDLSLLRSLTQNSGGTSSDSKRAVRSESPNARLRGGHEWLRTVSFRQDGAGDVLLAGDEMKVSPSRRAQGAGGRSSEFELRHSGMPSYPASREKSSFTSNGYPETNNRSRKGSPVLASLAHLQVSPIGVNGSPNDWLHRKPKWHEDPMMMRSKSFGSVVEKVSPDHQKQEEPHVSKEQDVRPDMHDKQTRLPVETVEVRKEVELPNLNVKEVLGDGSPLSDVGLKCVQEPSNEGTLLRQEVEEKSSVPIVASVDHTLGRNGIDGTKEAERGNVQEPLSSLNSNSLQEPPEILSKDLITEKNANDVIREDNIFMSVDKSSVEASPERLLVPNNHQATESSEEKQLHLEEPQNAQESIVLPRQLEDSNSGQQISLIAESKMSRTDSESLRMEESEDLERHPSSLSADVPTTTGRGNGDKEENKGEILGGLMEEKLRKLEPVRAAAATESPEVNRVSVRNEPPVDLGSQRLSSQGSGELRTHIDEQQPSRDFGTPPDRALSLRRLPSNKAKSVRIISGTPVEAQDDSTTPPDEQGSPAGEANMLQNITVISPEKPPWDQSLQGEEPLSKRNSPASLSRNMTLAEATDTILYCSSLMHTIVYKAAAYAMEKEELAGLASAPTSNGEGIIVPGLPKADHRDENGGDTGVGETTEGVKGAGSARRQLSYMAHETTPVTPADTSLQIPEDQTIEKVKSPYSPGDTQRYQKEDQPVKVVKSRCGCSIM